ncbi:hypothetical protein [Arthrobacter subterraneus]|uniref:hypothetical protein n=1 Tax=Arthrobacter subterraneus TaxID=335973 RepID=UPI0008F95979|nr:hypothetical protein [Arthrobacter subterraneus]
MGDERDEEAGSRRQPATSAIPLILPEADGSWGSGLRGQMRRRRDAAEKLRQHQQQAREKAEGQDNDGESGCASS